MNKCLVVSLFLACVSAVLVVAEPKPNQPAADEFDTLYELRVELVTKQLAIYESAVDDASAQTAAKQFLEMLPLQKKMRQLDKKLGMPSAERQKELSAKFESQLINLSTRSMMAANRVAKAPYGKVLHLAQLQFLAALGEKGAAQALVEIQGDPEFKAALEASEQAAAQQRAKLKTDPAIDQVFMAYLKTTDELNELLEKVTDEASARTAAPEVLKWVKTWEDQSKAFNAYGPAAGNTSLKYEAKMKASMGALVETVMKLHQNPEAAEPLHEVTLRIIKGLSDS